MEATGKEEQATILQRLGATHSPVYEPDYEEPDEPGTEQQETGLDDPEQEHKEPF